MRFNTDLMYLLHYSQYSMGNKSFVLTFLLPVWLSKGAIIYNIHTRMSAVAGEVEDVKTRGRKVILLQGGGVKMSKNCADGI